MNSDHPHGKRSGMIAMAAAALALFTLTVGLSASAQAQTEEAASNEPTPATLPAMLPTSITAGLPDPAGKVPTINGVPGSQVTNLDVSFPLALLVHSNRYVYSTTVQDNSYIGSCTVSYALTQVQNGKKVTLDSAVITKFKTAPGNIWLWVMLGKAIPNSPGLATLTGSFKCGTTTNRISSTVLLQ
jgi:hypothetical protein